MQLLKIQNTWFSEAWSAQEVFWALAIISTLLLVIFLLYILFSEEGEPATASTKVKRIQLEARTVLLFFAAFGWSTTISSYFPNSVAQSLLYGAIAGFLVTLFAHIWRRSASKSVENGSALTSMGKVSQSIPPHRAGIGKVYMKSNRVPIELDAITIGRELPVGAPVRIVSMLDDHTAVVESLDNRPGGLEA